MASLGAQHMNETIVFVLNNMLRNRAVDMAYYNLIFTTEGIVFDFLHKTFRTWILHTKPLKEFQYSDLELQSIIKKHEENFKVSYKNITSIKVKKRTFFTNARIEIVVKGSNEKIVLFSKTPLELKEYYGEIKPYLKEKIELI